MSRAFLAKPVLQLTLLGHKEIQVLFRLMEQQRTKLTLVILLLLQPMQITLS